MRPRVFLGGVILGFFLLSLTAFGQSLNGTISGVVKDPAGATIPSVELTLTNVATKAQLKTTSDTGGRYEFPGLTQAVYDLAATATGFGPYLQRGIAISVNQHVRIDIDLQVGTVQQSVEVSSNVSQLNFDNATRQDGVSPQTLNELPLIVNGAPRTSAQFAVLLPGVTTGGGDNAYDARINGGIQSGDEAVMDGVSMQQGTMSQSGMITLWDFRLTPDMISEFQVLTANYEPQYGSTTSANIVAVTKSGGNEFHGALYEYLRNTALNARQFGADVRPKDNEHDAGGAIGGPAKLPLLTTARNKTFFYFNFEAFRITGGVNRPTLSIPSMKERSGDFSDWRDQNTGALIPVYDPFTLRANPSYDPNQDVSANNLPYLRDQFMGCDGTQPNVICPTRFTNSLAKAWLKFLPTPTSDGPLNNYLVPQPVPDSILAQTNYYLIKIDEYFGSKDHFSGTIWRQTAPPKYVDALPLQIASGDFTDPQNSWVERLNWDHVFSPTLLNHFAAGYLNRNEGYGSLNTQYVNDFPKIPGVPNNNDYPSVMSLDDFGTYGSSRGINKNNVTTRPSYVANDLVTWVRGAHTFKFGGEIRRLGQNNHAGSNESGTFGFARASTGLQGITSGNSVASFLLETVDWANADYRTVSSYYARQKAYIWHIGDTWKVTPKLTLSLGVRWDNFTPTEEKYNRMAFFDPSGPNPAAGGRLGRLAFAGNDWGPASFGARYPEKDWRMGYAPRIGIAYALTPRTVVRTGYGIFYTQAFYPNWDAGMNLDGFNANISFSSTVGGLEPAFILSQGFPQDFQRPPYLDAGYRNGQGTQYRPFDANHLSNAQQWNLTIEHQLARDVFVNVAYVGNKGTRLPSQINPINALDPKYLSMGQSLYDEFQPGQTELDGVPIPYAGWTEQMTNCSPSVAQALLPYPQYCDAMMGLNENIGNSTYHSFQGKVEKRFSSGSYLLASYTLSKLITTTHQVDELAATWSGAVGVISPFERKRNKAIATDDVPQAFSLAFVYQLPVGRGKRFLNAGGPLDRVVSGWELSSTVRLSSGTPLFFRSGQCDIPGQFRMGCIPGVLPGKEPWAQDKGSIDVNKPLFDRNSFEGVDGFYFYGGKGSRVTNYRGFGYKNQSLALVKHTKITERINLQLRGEFFNVWNWHSFTSGNSTEYGGSGAFDIWLDSPTFGMWNGAVSNPRNIQLGARLEF